MEAMRQKLRSEEGKQIYKKRGYTVEPVFGEMKWDGRKPSMNLRGLVKVRGEFSLMCLVHNVKKIVKKVLEGTVSLPGKYSKLIEEALPEYGPKSTIYTFFRTWFWAPISNCSGTLDGGLRSIRPLVKSPGKCYNTENSCR